MRIGSGGFEKNRDERKDKIILARMKNTLTRTFHKQEKEDLKLVPW